MTKPYKLKPDYSNNYGGINAYNSNRDDGRDAILKEQFLRDGRAMLRAIAKAMGGEWTLETRINRGGVAVSGEVMGDLSKSRFGKRLFVQIYATSGAGGRETDHLVMLVQVRQEREIIGRNIWLDVTFDSDALAKELLLIAEGYGL